MLPSKIEPEIDLGNRKTRFQYTGITSRCWGFWFPSTKIKQVAHIFGCAGAYQSYVDTILESIKCAMALCLKIQHAYPNLKCFIPRNC